MYIYANATIGREPDSAPLTPVDFVQVECRLLVWLQRTQGTGARWTAAPDLNISLPIGAGQIAFGDMDSDGNMV